MFAAQLSSQQQNMYVFSKHPIILLSYFLSPGYIFSANNITNILLYDLQYINLTIASQYINNIIDCMKS